MDLTPVSEPGRGGLKVSPTPTGQVCSLALLLPGSPESSRVLEQIVSPHHKFMPAGNP